ncbi:MAG: hypothetical protein V4590_03100 [Bacteroidota bacterium]
MLPYILLPNYFKWIGAGVFIAGFAIDSILSPDIDNLTSGYGLLIQIMVLTGLLLFTGARQRIEDELVKHYRLIALQWAVFLFILLRAGFKIYAWSVNDEDAYVEFGVNFLLELYVIFFYYLLFVKHRIQSIFTKS